MGSSDFAVSALSRLTGATAVTEVSRPAKKNKSSEVSSHTNSTSTKSTRKGKVTIFTRCLYGKRDHTRACLEQRLKERARSHLIQFDKFFFSAFGTNPHDLIKSLRTHYCACVMEKVQKVLDKYDQFHCYWDPRIIVNYCCTHRINIHYKVPCMRL